MDRLRAYARALCLLMCCSACAPATQAAFIPRLDVGLRSARTGDQQASAGGQRVQQRWDLTVFANLAWTSQRSAALIPSRMELTPDAWIAPCADQDCFWDESDVDNAAFASEGAAP